MAEKTELAVIEVKDLIPVIYADKEAFFLNKDNQIQPVADKIISFYKSLVVDGETEEGRKELKKLGTEINKVIEFIDNEGKKINDELKEKPKQIDAGRRIIREQLKKLRVDIIEPLTKYEAEQARIKAEEQAKIEAQRKAEQEELELLRAEKAQQERDEQIRLKAIEDAKLKAENEANAAKLELEKERAENKRKEDARVAEENRKKAEEARRLADVEHKRQIKFVAYNCLLSNGFNKEDSIKIINLIDDGEVEHVSINY